MKIIITGSNSGVGQGLANSLINLGHDVVGLTRQDLDLSNIDSVLDYTLPFAHMLINCAGTDIGGKIDFINHNAKDINKILNVNLTAPVLLTHKALATNQSCKIVNITSTNNNRYWPNNLAYSLTKKGLENFGNMLKIEYPNAQYLEIRLGLTKTNFNRNRYQNCKERYKDLYDNNAHLSVVTVSKRIVDILFDSNIKFIEISP